MLQLFFLYYFHISGLQITNKTRVCSKHFLPEAISHLTILDVNANMPEEFKELYPATRVILDCTEIFVETPSSVLLQSQLYSSYKSKTTLKGLIGIAPHGAITFISSLFTGAISDKEITRCSGIIDLLEPNDSVMADKGFEIEGMLRERRVGLNRLNKYMKLKLLPSLGSM